MKKILIILFAFTSISAYSQATLPEGSKRLNAGFGFSNFGLPVYLGLDLGLTDEVTIGPQVSFRTYSQNIFGTTYRQNLIVIGVNADYHFNTLLELPSEIDVYGGLHVGYYLWEDANDVLGVGGFESSGVGVSLHVGGRYFITPELAFNLELGGGTASGGKIGITYQF